MYIIYDVNVCASKLVHFCRYATSIMQSVNYTTLPCSDVVIKQNMPQKQRYK